MNTNDEANQEFIRKSTEEVIIEVRGGICGILISVFLLALAAVMTGLAFSNLEKIQPAFIAVAIISFILFLINYKGFFTIGPYEAVLLTYYGKYIGTVKENGFFWINPFTCKTNISLKSKNLNGQMMIKIISFLFELKKKTWCFDVPRPVLGYEAGRHQKISTT